MWRLRARWSYSHAVLLLCWAGWISIYLCKSALPPLLPVLAEDLGLTHVQGGLLVTAYLAGYVSIKVPAGIMARRFGIRRVLVAGMVGYAFSSMLNFLAADFAQMFMLRFLVGLFQGVHLPLANALLSDRFGSRQGRAIGFHESGPNVGTAVAFPLTVAIASTWGWRWAFLLLSLPAFALALAASIILRADDREVELAASAEIGPSGDLRLRSFRRVLIPMALAHATYNLCFRSLLNFAPSYLVEFRGMSLATAGLIATILPASGFFAKLSSGFLAERLGERRAICAASALSGALIASMTILAGERALSIVFILMGLALYSFSPSIYASVTSTLPSPLKAVGLGMVTMTGDLVGAISTPIVGLLIDARGYGAALQAISASALVAAAVIYAIMSDEPLGPGRYGAG